MFTKEKAGMHNKVLPLSETYGLTITGYMCETVTKNTPQACLTFQGSKGKWDECPS